MNMTDKIIKCSEIHEGKYDYSETKYVNAKTKVKIICPVHGVFEQLLYSHLKGFGCDKCAIKTRVDTKRKKFNNDIFFKECNEIHGNRYDYSKVVFNNLGDVVTIICPEHGEFEQKLSNHSRGSGCVKCFNERRKDNNIKMDSEKFINILNSEFPENKYDFSKVNYVNAKTPITIICPDHGEFKRCPDYITNSKKICVKCHNKKDDPKKLTTEEFISRGNELHGNKYDYSKVKYRNAKSKVTIICPEHGEFKQNAYNHINVNNFRGCHECGKKYNKSENQLKEFITSLNIDFEENNRMILNGKELDIYIPSKNVAIEYDGLYWHSELYKENNYHLNKTELCIENNIQLIHVFEDEWLEKSEIVKSRIKNILGFTTDKVYARKCDIREVETSEIRDFFNDNHLQGYTNSKIKLGLFYENELVSGMLFSKPRLGIGGDYDGYELTRFANKINLNVIGGASRLLKNFIKIYEPELIKSYVDLRWSNGGLYRTLGFTENHTNKPNYWYVQGLTRKHRFNFRKNKIKDMGVDISNKTERELMRELGYLRIYDCGTIQYELKP